MSTIGIIGAGGMGRGIARQLARAGHEVVITDRTIDTAAEVAAEAAAGQPGRVRAGQIEDGLANEYVVLALWHPGTVEFATAHARELAGRIVIDIANPLDATYTRLSLAPTTSAAEQLAGALPDSTVVKAFNTVPAPTLFDAVIDDVGLDTFVASDDDDARAAVIGLLRGSGLRPIAAGALENARLLERLCAFGIELGQLHGVGFVFGIKFLPAALPAAT